MAFNMDTAIRVIGKVQGVNDFKALAERLLDVGKASDASKTGFQQLNAESGRLASESVRAAGGVRAQAAALQDLSVRTRANATDMKRGAAEVRAFSGVLQRLRGDSVGVVDGVGASAAKAAGSVKQLGGAFAPVEQQIAKARGGAELFGGVLQRLRGQSAGVVDGVGESAEKAANNIRALSGALTPTDQQLAKVRREVLALGESSKQTERSLAQQVGVLKELRSQADVNGRLYRQLTGDIDRLKGATQGLDAANGKSVSGFEKLANASRAVGNAYQAQINMGARLWANLEKGEGLYRSLGREIDTLKAKAAGLDLAKGLMMPGARGIGGVASGVTGAIGQMVALRRELSRTSPGRVVLAGEGAAVAGVAGAAGAGVAAGLGGVGGGLSGIASQLDLIASKAAALPGVLKPLGSLLASPAAAAGDAIANWGASLTAAQAKLAALSAPFEAIGTAISSIGPGTAAAAGVASLAIASVYDVLKRRADEAQRDLEQSFRGISDEVQRTLQQLTRLYDQLPAARLQAQQELRTRNMERLGEAAPGSIEARRAANAVVSAEREIAKIQGEQNQLLEDARTKQGAAARLQEQQRDVARQRLETQRKLTEQTIKEREELQQANAVARAIRRNQERVAPEQERQAEAARLLGQQRDIARQRLEVQRQLTEQARKEREELQQANAIAGSIRRNRERVAADQERLRRRAAEAFPRSTVLALPAAGQTTAPGTGQAISGGARILSNFETAGTRDVVGAPMGTLPEALQRSKLAADQAKGSLRELFVEVTKSQQASNGSVNSLQRQRAAWQALQNAVNPAAPAYERARQNVQRLDEQLKKLTATQEKAVKLRGGIGSGAAGSALGALAAGGGFQGAFGALAGGLAFSGGPAGLAAGAAVTAVGATAGLAARVGVDAETAQVRLKALTEQFGEYNQAQAAAARIAGTLRISQTEAADSFSKLYAALRPTGVTLKEIEDAFIGFSAAARASGATATESSAALLQLKQALGSGVLQGDELRSVREQAPAAAQAIAKEMGVTIGELKKLGSEGKITTDIVLRALARLKNENLGKLNAQFATSAQALQDLRIAIDGVGVEFAKAFGPSAVMLIRGVTSVIRDLAESGIWQTLQESGKGFAQNIENVGLAWEYSAGKLKPFINGLERLGFLFKNLTPPGWAMQMIGNAAGNAANVTENLAGLERQRRRDAFIGPTAPQRFGPDVPERLGGNAAVEAAARERAAARARAEQAQNKETTDKKAKAEKSAIDKQTDIRLDAEKRIAEFREQSLERASQFERDLADQRLDLERSVSEARRRVQAQQEDAALEIERQRLRSMGLGTEAIDTQLELNQATRRFSEERINIEQNAVDRRVQLERSIEEYKVSVAEGIRSILIDAGERMAEAMQGGARGAAGIIARTGNTGDSTGPHLDARWANRRPITAADVDRYVMVNGRTPSSFGVTSGYGPRNLFGRSFHAGVDFGTPSGSKITLRNGAQLLRNLGNTGAGGYAIEIMTTEGPMRLLHLQAGSAAAPGAARPSAAVAASGLVAPAETPGLDRVRAAGARLDQAIGGERQARLEALSGEQVSQRRELFGNRTAELDSQLKSVRDQRSEFERMVELQRSGLSPEVARQRIENERIAEIERKNLQVLEDQLVKDLSIAGLTDKQRTDLQAILSSVRERQAAQDGIVEGLTSEAVALEALRETYERNRQLAEGIADTIGQGIGSAFDVLLNGTEDWGDSLREIAGGVLKDIARQVLQLMVIQPIVKGITAGFGFANGGIMTDQGPLPLRAYANGGIANSPQVAVFGEGRRPEAYVPLPDGRRIPVALQGAGGTTQQVVNNVNVSVDAKGSNVEGNSQRANELGRVVAAAVQQALIRHKRADGLLAGA